MNREPEVRDEPRIVPVVPSPLHSFLRYAVHSLPFTTRSDCKERSTEGRNWKRLTEETVTSGHELSLREFSP